MGVAVFAFGTTFAGVLEHEGGHQREHDCDNEQHPTGPHVEKAFSGQVHDR
jgi:hypothetical protein